MIGFACVTSKATTTCTYSALIYIFSRKLHVTLPLDSFSLIAWHMCFVTASGNVQYMYAYDTISITQVWIRGCPGGSRTRPLSLLAQSKQFLANNTLEITSEHLHLLKILGDDHAVCSALPAYTWTPFSNILDPPLQL